MDSSTLLITIDGPAGSGKSTISKGLAQALQGRRLDTGAIYRAYAWKVRESGTDVADHAALFALGEKLDLVMEVGGGIFVDGVDITDSIRIPSISQLASQIAAIPAVRNSLMGIQRQLAFPGPTVCEGRDMGTVVFPQAPVKFFLTATPEARARRRHEELRAKGDTISFDDVLTQQNERDQRDSSRDVAPLKPAQDAVLVDSTAMTIEEVILHMVTIARSRLNS